MNAAPAPHRAPPRSSSGAVSIKRCDFLGGRLVVPVASCELLPIIILGRENERFDDDELEVRVSNARMRYRWRRGPARAVCFFHSYRAAALQCTISLRCFCSNKCFLRGHKQLRRFYLSDGKVPVPRQHNDFAYGVPVAKQDYNADLDDSREPDWEHYQLLRSSGLASTDLEETWTTIAYSREYAPTANDVGHQLRLDVCVDYSLTAEGLAMDERQFWARFDYHPLPPEFSRSITTSCVLPTVPYAERRPIIAVEDRVPPLPPQRAITPGTALAEALGIGVNISRAKGGLPQSPLREQLREQRVAFLTEQAFADWTDGHNVLDVHQIGRITHVGAPPVTQHINNGSESTSFTVMTWNVLADIYATPEAYPCSEPHVLSWAFRRERILAEIINYSPDIICLQEIQGDHFEEFFAPALLRRGYEGLYKQKTTKLFRGSGKHKGGKYVCDGCATFFRVPKFHLLDHFGIEFARVMPPRHTRNDKRLLKDNVALVLCLEQLMTHGPADARGARADNNKHVLVIANTHILANPEAPDVKIWQANTLTSVLTEYMEKTSAFNSQAPSKSAAGLVVCGDFNSTPTSAVYELVTKGSCDARHPELQSSDVCSWLQEVELGHGLNLSSSYSLAETNRQQRAAPASSFQYEPEFTNYTHEYVGCLDYIFFDAHALKVQATLDLVSELQLLKEAYNLQLSDWALPSPQRPSDHLPLLSKFEWNK